MGAQLNRRWFNVASAPGIGNVAVGPATSGYATLGAANDGQTFDGVTFIDGTAWEVRNGCVYTHGTTTLTRGTLEDSSTGSPISLSSATTVMLSVGADTLRRYDSAALAHAAGANAATSMQVGTLYVVDGSTLTADRTYTLPATAKVGDRVGVMMSASSTDYEVILTAASGDTLNGVAGGTEWSRVFIRGEVIIMRCIADNATWMVEHDGRIPQYAMLALTAAASAEAANTFVRPTSQSGAWTAHSDNASLSTTSNGQIKVRRAGRFDMSCFGFSNAALGIGGFFSSALYKNGTTDILFASSFGVAGGTLAIGQQAGAAADAYPMSVDDYIVYQYRSSEGSKGLASSALPRLISWFSLKEIL